MEKKKQEFANLKIHKETRNMLRNLSKVLRKSMATILSEYIEELAPQVASFKKANISYEQGRITDSDVTLTITLSGSRSMIFGSGSEEDMRQALKDFKGVDLWQEK